MTHAQRLMPLVSFLLSISPTIADQTALADTLYGLTEQGLLMTLDTAGAELVGEPARCPLPQSLYQNFESVEYADGHFYASYDFGGSGKIVRFGFACGDETYIGESDLPIKGMTYDASEDIMYVGFDDSSNDASVGVLNLSTGAVSGIVTANPLPVSTPLPVLQSLAIYEGSLYFGGVSELGIFDYSTGDISPLCTVNNNLLCWQLGNRGRSGRRKGCVLDDIAEREEAHAMAADTDLTTRPCPPRGCAGSAIGQTGSINPRHGIGEP